jgi:hypothetical protein
MALAIQLVTVAAELVIFCSPPRDGGLEYVPICANASWPLACKFLRNEMAHASSGHYQSAK